MERERREVFMEGTARTKKCKHDISQNFRWIRSCYVVHRYPENVSMTAILKDNLIEGYRWKTNYEDTVTLEYRGNHGII